MSRLRFETPRPEGYVEGTVMSPDHMLDWLLAMPREEQLVLVTQLAERAYEGDRCFREDHAHTNGILAAQLRHANEQLRRLETNAARL